MLESKAPAPETAPLVFVVGDDVPQRESLELIIRSAGLRAEGCKCTHDFLARPRTAVPSCLVLQVSLDDPSGLDLQQDVASERSHIPIVFIAGYADVATAVRAMKAGAIDFLTKPVDGRALLTAIESALERSHTALLAQLAVGELRARYETLTPREREVMARVTAGLMNKQVGWELGISEATVKAHRGHMMRKMKARSLAALIAIAARLSGEVPQRFSA